MSKMLFYSTKITPLIFQIINMTNSISCPVCQNICSTQALSCPKCGHPFLLKESPKKSPEKPISVIEKIFNILAIISLVWVATHAFFIIYSLFSYGLGDGLRFWVRDKGYFIPYLIFGLIAYAFFAFLKNLEKKRRE